MTNSASIDAAGDGGDGAEHQRRRRALPAAGFEHGIARPVGVVIDGDGRAGLVLAGGRLGLLARAINRCPSRRGRGADIIALVHFIGVAQIELIAVDLPDGRFFGIAVVLDFLLDHGRVGDGAGRGRPLRAGAARAAAPGQRRRRRPARRSSQWRAARTQTAARRCRRKAHDRRSNARSGRRRQSRTRR